MEGRAYSETEELISNVASLGPPKGWFCLELMEQ